MYGGKGGLMNEILDLASHSKAYNYYQAKRFMLLKL